MTPSPAKAMQALVERILARTRKKWLRTRPLFQPFKPVDPLDLGLAEGKVGASLPDDLKVWLLSAGYGDVDEVLSFRHDWFHTITKGHLHGAVIFAQDDRGNFYAYARNEPGVHFFARSSPEYAKIAPSFKAFMEELEHRDFKLNKWMDSLTLMPYDWDA